MLVLPVDWADFTPLSSEPPTSIAWASNGSEGSGKSYFGLTAPQPIFVCAFDPYGMDRVSSVVKAGKDIRIGRYPFIARKGQTKNELGDAATEIWDQFTNDFRTALAHARTILWDREDLAWELLRYSAFGAQNAAPKEYGELNAEYIGLIQEAAAAHVNLGLLRGLREKWISKFDPEKGKLVPHNTGEMCVDGMKKIPDHVDITLDHQWDATRKSFITVIRKFPNVEYRDMDVPDLTFAMMAMAAYPDSDMESWQ